MTEIRARFVLLCQQALACAVVVAVATPAAQAACIADAATDAVVLDRTELEDSLWASPDDVRSALERRPGARFEAPPHFAIAHSLLLHWLERSDRLAADGMAA